MVEKLNGSDELKEIFKEWFARIQHIALTLADLEKRIDRLERGEESHISREVLEALEQEQEREARDLANLIFPQEKD